MSYGPFLGGKRICLGKTFAEIATKAVGPAMINAFNFEFLNKDFYVNKPSNHIMMREIEQCFVKVTKASL